MTTIIAWEMRPKDPGRNKLRNLIGPKAGPEQAWKQQKVLLARLWSDYPNGKIPYF